MRRAMVLFAALLVAGCVKPAQVTVKPAPFEVAAPFEKTWNAVIDVFAERNIPIVTIDKSSGLIVGPLMTLSSEEGNTWASCPGGLIRLAANRATFNILVRTTGVGSTVTPTARWESTRGGEIMVCNSKYVWERSLALRIKAGAEGK